MDNLTHSLTGLALSRAGLNRVCPRATAILLIAANAPDTDALSGLRSQLSYLEYHRHITHALLFVPVMALFAILLASIGAHAAIAAFCNYRRLRIGNARGAGAPSAFT